MKKKNKVIINSILIIIAILAVGIFAVLNSAEGNMEKILDATIENVDMSNIPDGLYLGTYNAFPISVNVEVHIKNHLMDVINLTKHTNGQGKPAEVIIDNIINAQSLQVDTISGATYSSKAILLAIQNALNGEAEK